MRKAYVPTHLDDRPRFLFWEAEVAVTAIASMGAGALLNAVLPGTLLGLLFGGLLHRALSSRVRGWCLHMTHWHLGALSLPATIPSAKRRFLG